MRSLPRPDQPDELTEWKGQNPAAGNQAEPFLPWADLGQAAKAEAQAVLCRSQRHLCAYCESRIEPDGHRMKIEHWLDQSGHPEHRFDWRNWLAVCWGGQRPPGYEDRPTVTPYCGHARGNRPLHLNSYTLPEAVPPPFRFYPDGKIAGTTPTAQSDVETLKLDHGRLNDNRKVVYQKLQQRLRARGFAHTQLTAERRCWLAGDADGRLREYLSCALFHLDRWVNKQQGRRAP